MNIYIDIRIFKLISIEMFAGMNIHELVCNTCIFSSQWFKLVCTLVRIVKRYSMFLTTTYINYVWFTEVKCRCLVFFNNEDERVVEQAE